MVAGGGGGGGYYGGGGTYVNSSGGGSGYIGNEDLSDKVMYCYNCTEHTEETNPSDFNEDWYTVSTENVSAIPTSGYAKIGNGYAKITFVW